MLFFVVIILLKTFFCSLLFSQKKIYGESGVSVDIQWILSRQVWFKADIDL